MRAGVKLAADGLDIDYAQREIAGLELGADGFFAAALVGFGTGQTERGAVEFDSRVQVFNED